MAIFSIANMTREADFGLKLGKALGKRATHHHPIFLRVPTPLPAVCLMVRFLKQVRLFHKGIFTEFYHLKYSIVRSETNYNG